MFYIAGLSLAFLSIVGAIFHLHQSASLYFDVVALLVVIGGTIAVAITTLPWHFFPEILSGLKKLFLGDKREPRALLTESMRFIRSSHSGVPAKDIQVQGLAKEILNDGAEMLSLGFSSEHLRAILSERIRETCDRQSRVANAVRSLSKYPPAFGLTGTVLGLVSLMRGLSDASGAEETGMRMAVALVATLYGLLISNLIINPAGESLLKQASIERKDADLALQAVLLAADRVPLLECHEMLNSFVHSKDRIPLSSTLSSEFETPQGRAA
ncbi:MAG: MotA/TolQ/ExbB proton channel family protein [Bdellovibrionales bacterium]|nr:MotA/TolQ/ExbB proton channel family protein [Bdellovibrionales bacterium]